MKVLHVVHGLGAELGGLSKSVLGLCNALSAAGAEIEIAATFAGISPQIDNGEKIRVHQFPHSPAAGLKYSRKLGVWLHNNVSRFDLVHVHGVFNYPAVAAMRACRKNKTPFVLSVHGMLNDAAVNQKSLKKYFFWHLAQKKPAQRSAGLHALSNFEAGKIGGRIPGVHIHVIPNGIHPADYANETHTGGRFENHKTVLYLGRLDPIKGIDNLLNAIPLVRTRSDVKYSIAGGGRPVYVNELKQTAEKLGVAKKIEFAGRQNEEQANALLNNADVFIQPSRSEGFSIAILEAMALGTPVVMSKHCNFEFASENNLALVVENNPESLAAAISQALNDKKETRERASRARSAIVRHFAWDKLAAEYLNFYQSAQTR